MAARIRQGRGLILCFDPKGEGTTMRYSGVILVLQTIFDFATVVGSLTVGVPMVFRGVYAGDQIQTGVGLALTTIAVILTKMLLRNAQEASPLLEMIVEREDAIRELEDKQAELLTNVVRAESKARDLQSALACHERFAEAFDAMEIGALVIRATDCGAYQWLQKPSRYGVLAGPGDVDFPDWRCAVEDWIQHPKGLATFRANFS